MIKIITLTKKYWYVLVLLIVGAFLALKKKRKISGSNKEDEALSTLERLRVRDAVAKDWYKSVALQLAENLGTAYDWFDPRRWTEDDKKVYELVKDLTPSDFKSISALYFEVYAKGRNLSEDLAKNLDAKLYALLKVK